MLQIISTSYHLGVRLDSEKWKGLFSFKNLGAVHIF